MSTKPYLICIYWLLLVGIPLFAGTDKLIYGDIYLKEFVFKLLLFAGVFAVCIYKLAINPFKCVAVKYHTFDLVVFAYFLYILIRYLVSGAHYYDYFTVLLPSWLLVLTGRQFARPNAEQITRLVIRLIIVLSIAQAVIALSQWFQLSNSWNSYLPLTGTFHNSGPLSIWMTLAIPCCLFALHHERMAFRILAVCCLAFAIVIIALCASRTAMIAALATTLFYYRLKLRWLLRPPILITAIGSVAVLIYFLLSFKVNSALGRLSVWKICLEMIKDAPVAGLGLNGFNDNYYCYLLKNISTVRPEAADYAFNDLIQLTVEQGIIGLAFFATIIGFLFFKANSVASINCTRAIIIAIITSSITSYPFQIISVWATLVTAVILTSALLFTNLRIIRVSFLSKTVLLTALCVAAVWLTVLEVRILQSKLIATAAEQDMRNERFESAMQKFSVANRLINYDKKVYLGYANALQLAGFPDSGLHILTMYNKICEPFSFITLGNIYKQKHNAASAESNYRSAMLLQPGMLYPKYLLIKLYYESGQFCKAYQMANEILNFKARIPSTAIEEMKSESLLILSSLQEQPKMILACDSVLPFKQIK